MGVRVRAGVCVGGGGFYGKNIYIISHPDLFLQIIIVDQSVGVAGVGVVITILGSKGGRNMRDDRCRRLQRQLYAALVEPDGGTYLKQTGSLLRSNTLRNHQNRKNFDVILKADVWDEDGDPSKEQRFWTKRLVEDAIRGLVEEHKLEIPMLPGFCFSEWLKDQAKKVQDLAQRAKRNKSNPSKASRPSEAMSDWDETIPMDLSLEKASLWPLLENSVSLVSKLTTTSLWPPFSLYKPRNQALDDQAAVDDAASMPPPPVPGSRSVKTFIGLSLCVCNPLLVISWRCLPNLELLGRSRAPLFTLWCSGLSILDFVFRPDASKGVPAPATARGLHTKYLAATLQKTNVQIDYSRNENFQNRSMFPPPTAHDQGSG